MDINKIDYKKIVKDNGITVSNFVYEFSYLGGYYMVIENPEEGYALGFGKKQSQKYYLYYEWIQKEVMPYSRRLNVHF